MKLRVLYCHHQANFAIELSYIMVSMIINTFL